ncbi:hypothetical protein GCM10010515_58970 [Streptomyces fructofermentans]|uniref:Uncharacterized protein n=1 Tax=Streptomyces fructofermentans TaxID=152141 RepID=A0A918U2N4_9ACTN|nr:hypothetical protein GCM10010515_58970 [Streptomyces fructofermentans]
MRTHSPATVRAHTSKVTSTVPPCGCRGLGAGGCRGLGVGGLGVGGPGRRDHPPNLSSGPGPGIRSAPGGPGHGTRPDGNPDALHALNQG